MSFGNQVAWPHVSAPFANPSIYSQQSKSLSVSDIGWPQKPDVANSKLDWTHFFGTNPGYQPPTDYSLSYRNETMNLPQAFHGNNVFLSSLIVNMISLDDQWPIREALPWRKNNLALTISWDKWIFDNHLLGRNPEQSVPRLLTSHREVRTASTVRHGIAFMLEFGFMDTPDGVVNYNANLRQMANAIISTLVLGAQTALLECDFKKSKMYSVTRLSNKTMLNNLLGIQVGEWGCIQKVKEGIRLLATRYKHVFKNVSKKNYNMAIFPRGTGDYLEACDMNEINGWFTNRNGNTPSTPAKFRKENGVTYYEWAAVDVGYENEEDENVRPFERSRMIGDFFQLNRQSLHNCPPTEFRTAYMDRYIYNENTNSHQCMSYAKCVAKSMLFERRDVNYDMEDTSSFSELYFSGHVQYATAGDTGIDVDDKKGYRGSLNTLSGAGRIVLGPYSTWEKYLLEHGLLGDYIASVINHESQFKPSHVKAFMRAFGHNAPTRNIPTAISRTRNDDGYINWGVVEKDFVGRVVTPLLTQQQRQVPPREAKTREVKAQGISDAKYAMEGRSWIYSKVSMNVPAADSLKGMVMLTLTALDSPPNDDAMKMIGQYRATNEEVYAGLPENQIDLSAVADVQSIQGAITRLLGPEMTRNLRDQIAQKIGLGAATLTQLQQLWVQRVATAVTQHDASSNVRGNATGHLYAAEQERLQRLDDPTASRIIEEMPTSVQRKISKLTDQGFGGHLDALWSKRAGAHKIRDAVNSFAGADEFVKVMQLVQEAYVTSHTQEPSLGDIKDGSSRLTREEKDQAALMHKGLEALLAELYYNSLGGVLQGIRKDINSGVDRSIIVKKLAVTIDRMYRFARSIEVEIAEALKGIAENSLVKWQTMHQKNTQAGGNDDSSNPYRRSNASGVEDLGPDGKIDPVEAAKLIRDILKRLPIDNVDFVHFSLAHDCWPLFNVYGHRLSKEYIMAPAAFLRGYGELGNTLYGRTSFTLSDNAPRGLHVGVFNMYAKSIIFNEENLQLVPDVFCLDYIGGCGGDIWDFQDPQQLDNFKNGSAAADIVIFLGPPDELVDSNYINVLGYDHHLLGTSGDGDSFPSWHRDQAAWCRLSHPTTPVWLNNPNVEDNCAYNTINFETFQLACVYQGQGRVDPQGFRVLNKGHWGEDDGVPGVAAVRKRMAMYMKMSEYSHYKHNVTGISSHSMPIRV
jgi:hypothetical protein